MTIRALIEAVERGEFWGDLPRPHALHTDLCWKAFNGSLDAALALHAAALPGWGWTAGPWGARVFLYSDAPRWDGSKRQEVELVNSPARAWLLAILRAVEAEGKA